MVGQWFIHHALGGLALGVHLFKIIQDIEVN